MRWCSRTNSSAPLPRTCNWGHARRGWTECIRHQNPGSSNHAHRLVQRSGIGQGQCQKRRKDQEDAHGSWDLQPSASLSWSYLVYQAEGWTMGNGISAHLATILNIKIADHWYKSCRTNCRHFRECILPDQTTVYARITTIRFLHKAKIFQNLASYHVDEDTNDRVASPLVLPLLLRLYLWSWSKCHLSKVWNRELCNRSWM